jgi:peptidoglycan/LPS O-acetylase OafA/YrhL
MLRDFFFTNLPLIHPHFRLPGVFEGNPHHIVNGSLWTLPAEARMYVLVALLGAMGVLRSGRAFNLFLLVCLATWLINPESLPLVSDHPKYARLAAFFATGAWAYVNRSWLVTSRFLLVMFVLVAVVSHNTPIFMIAYGGLLTYGLLWLAFVPNWHWFSRLGDYFYGLYIYAFPVQQCVSYFCTDSLPYQNFLLASAVTLALAVASWHWMERPALDLKRISIRGWLRTCFGRA